MAGRRHRAFWVAAGIFVTAIAGLVTANVTRFDPKDVQVEFEAKFAEVRNLPESDVLKKDALLEELLRNESYKEHAKAIYREVDRFHNKIHEPAMLELEAKKTVAPFLARCKDLPRISPEEVRLLYDESRSHLLNYGSTRQGAPLREVQAQLKTLLDKQVRIEPKEILELQKDVIKATDAGKFKDASDLTANFRKRTGSSEYDRQLREIEAMVARKAAAAVKPR
jgi:hypothetical protein